MKKSKKEPRIKHFDDDGLLSEQTIYITNTGRQTSPTPHFNGRFINALKRLERWQIDECVEEARSRGDWFNLIWLEELQRRVEKSHKEGTVTTAEKHALNEYMSNPEWMFEMPYKMTREI